MHRLSGGHAGWCFSRPRFSERGTERFSSGGGSSSFVSTRHVITAQTTPVSDCGINYRYVVAACVLYLCKRLLAVSHEAAKLGLISPVENARELRQMYLNRHLRVRACAGYVPTWKAWAGGRREIILGLDLELRWAILTCFFPRRMLALFTTAI